MRDNNDYNSMYSGGGGYYDAPLDACCQRELESNRRRNELERNLRSHDIVAQRERRRRHLVTIPDQFLGCRCMYDPNSDGGDYRSLIELRQKREANKEKDDQDDNNKEFGAEEKKDESFPQPDKSKSNDDNDDDDDSEFDYLLDDPELPGEGGEEIKLLEERRRAEIEYDMLRVEIAMQHGYGVVRQIHPGRILRAAGLVPGTRDPPYAVVIHLLDPDSIASASLDLHLESIAPKLGRGTKFMRSGGRTVLSFEADLVAKVLPRLNMDTDIPALIAVREGVVVNVSRGLRELTGSNSSSGRDNDVEVVPDVVTDWLDHCGVLIQQYPNMDEVCRIRPEEEALMEYMRNQKPSAPVIAAEEEFYNCGVKGCNKVYFHEHVGTKTDEQNGLLVSENDMLNAENKI